MTNCYIGPLVSQWLTLRKSSVRRGYHSEADGNNWYLMATDGHLWQHGRYAEARRSILQH